MQQLTRRSLGPGQCCGRARVPPRRLASPRPMPIALYAAGTPDQPSTSGSRTEESSSAAAADPSPMTVVEATAIEPEAETSTSGSEAEYDNPYFPEVPLSTNRAAGLQYLALGAAYAVAGGATAVAAFQSPQLLLPSASPWAATMLGCVAAGYLRAAGVFFHLKAAADNKELLCWRHQRLALAAAAYGLLAAGSQVVGVASPQLAGLQVLLGALTVAVVANVARSAWAVRPFVAVAMEQETLGDAAGVVWGGVVKAASTVAGVLLVTIAAISLLGFGSVVLSAAPALPAPLGAWPSAALPVLDPAAAGLRRLAAAGLLLAAASSAALLDFADSVRQEPAPWDVDHIKRTMVENMIRTRDRLAKYYMPSPKSYGVLNLSYIAAAAVQAYFIVAAPSLGVNVNLDGALWGPLYGTAFLGLSYGLVALTKFDWNSVLDSMLYMVGHAAQLFINFFDAFVWKVEWAEKTRRV